MPFTRAHWKAGIALFFSFVVEAWEMMILILVSDLIATDFGLNPTQLGSLIGSIFLGMIPGCLIWGKICDSRGRKFTMIASLLSYGVVSLISAASPTYTILWWTRFASGAALAGVLVATFIYFEELLPVKHRGPATVYLASGWPLGMLCFGERAGIGFSRQVPSPVFGQLLSGGWRRNLRIGPSAAACRIMPSARFCNFPTVSLS